jgi:hypothetical protein
MRHLYLTFVCSTSNLVREPAAIEQGWAAFFCERYVGEQFNGKTAS